MGGYRLSFDLPGFQNALKNLCFPVWIEKGRSKPALAATSFLCSYAGESFLITAGHTFGEASKHHERLFVVDRMKRKFYLEDKSAYFEEEDIGVTRLEGEEKAAFLSGGSAIDINRKFPFSFNGEMLIFFFGFPASKYKSANESLAFTYVLTRQGKEDGKGGFSGVIGIKNIDTVKHGEKRKAQLPQLQGMSGGPAFYYPSSGGVQAPFFAGVGVRWHKNERQNEASLQGIGIGLVIPCLNETLRHATARRSGSGR